MTLQELLGQPDHSVPDINIYNQLDTVPYSERNVILGQLIRKLVTGGTISFHGLDINLLAKYILEDKLTIENINEVISKVESVDNIYRMERFLIDNNCTITKRATNNGQYFFVAKYKM